MLAVDHSDLTLRIGSIATLCIGAIILLLLAWIILLRLARRRKERRHQRVTALWRPILAQCLFEAPASLPRLDPRDHIIFLHLWNHCFESIRGDASGHLVALARRVGSDRMAKELLQARALRRRLLGIVTLGHLRERSVWPELSALLHHANAFLSFIAAEALLHIDAQAAVPLLVPVMSRRRDWSPLKVVTMLKAADPDLAADAITQAAIRAEPEIGGRLIRHLASTRSVRGLPPLRTFLRQRPPPDQFLAACLFLFGECSDPTDLPALRRHLSHPTWYVRLQAAAALGKMGTEEDEARLVALLNDAHWWVRYRAGEALVSLPSMTSEKLAHLQGSLGTLESQEILAPLVAKFSAAASLSIGAA